MPPINANVTSNQITATVGETQIDVNVSGGFGPSTHTHDDRYYTEGEVDTLLAGKQATGSYAASSHAHGNINNGGTLTDTSVVLLLHFDGSDGSTAFTDSSPNALSFPVLSGSPVITTSNSKLGGASLAASGGVIGGVGNQSLPDFAAGDFTVEAWVWRPAGTGNATIFGCGGAVGQNGFHLWIDSSDAVHVDDFAAGQFSGGAVPSDEWVHISAVNQGGTHSVYINGVLAGTAAGVAGQGPYSDVYIGGWDSFLSNTLIDELRISKVARYSANFTPATAPFASLSTNAVVTTNASGQVVGVPTIQASKVAGLAAVATSGAYSDLTGTPAAYTLPTASSTVTGGVRIGSGVSIDGSGVISVSTNYAAASHTHGISDVTGLQTALDGKQASGSYAAATHGHAIGDVTGLQTALDGKAALSHTHAAIDISGLATVAKSGSYNDLTNTPTIPQDNSLLNALIFG